MTTLSIVIPIFNRYDLLHQCLYDLYQHCRNSLTEVLVVNDASTDESVYKGLAWWKEQKMLPIRELRLEENHMFLKASNKGMKKARGEILCLLSNDVRLHGDICKDIQGIIEHNRKVLIGGRLLSGSTGWNDFGNGRIYPYLEGWLLACTAEAWEEFGGFYEPLSPCDFEDVFISTLAISRGYSLVPLDVDKTHHIGAQSIKYGPEREKITKRNREIFRSVWVDKHD